MLGIRQGWVPEQGCGSQMHCSAMAGLVWKRGRTDEVVEGRLWEEVDLGVAVEEEAWAAAAVEEEAEAMAECGY